jgi:lysyl-tRNA synthetase class 2
VPGRDGSQIDLEAPWRKAAIFDLVSEALGEPVDVDTDVTTLVAHAEARNVAVKPQWGAAQVLVELYEQLVEHSLITPTFVSDYPADVKPLAKKHRSTPGLNEAWDLIINGVELARPIRSSTTLSCKGSG